MRVDLVTIHGETIHKRGEKGSVEMPINGKMFGWLS
jgi:hypothetical protein